VKVNIFCEIATITASAAEKTAAAMP